jgi:hypothetical protein
MRSRGLVAGGLAVIAASMEVSWDARIRERDIFGLTQMLLTCNTSSY